MSHVEVPFEVQKAQDGLRVDSYLVLRLERYSRAEVQRTIAEGRVFIRGRMAKASSRVAWGETVLIRYPRRTEPPPAFSALPVVYEDEHLLAINKPGDLLTHPTDKVVQNTVTSILKKQFDGAKLHLAHRLDRETSGLLLLAKTPASARALFAQFSGRFIEKEYLALAAGKIPWKRKSVDVPIGSEGLGIRVRQKTGEGRPAVTEFRVLKSSDRLTLVSARPKTGRLHQIRVHLAHLGHPVIGDKLYTGRGEVFMKAVEKTMTEADLETLGAQRQMLHAHTMSVEHPATRKPLDLHAPTPEDFRLLSP